MNFFDIAPPIVWGTIILFTGVFVLYKLAVHWDQVNDMKDKK